LLSIATVTADDFRKHIGTTFDAAGEGEERTPLVLIEVEENPVAAAPGATRVPFSVTFRGAAGIRLPQRIYDLRHDLMGEMSIFLVPVRPNSEGPRFEAVFN
jgi:hypothetical protein